MSGLLIWVVDRSRMSTAVSVVLMGIVNVGVIVIVVTIIIIIN